MLGNLGERNGRWGGLLFSCSSIPAFDRASWASRGKWSSTTDAAIVMGISVCSDSFDVSVASVSASASISGVSCGNGGVEDILVGGVVLRLIKFTGDDDVIIIRLREVLSNLIKVGFRR